MPDHPADSNSPKLEIAHEADRGSLADRTPFFVPDRDLEGWVKEHFPVNTPADVDRLKRALKQNSDDLRLRFEKQGWRFED